MMKKLCKEGARGTSMQSMHSYDLHLSGLEIGSGQLSAVDDAARVA